MILFCVIIWSSEVFSTETTSVSTSIKEPVEVVKLAWDRLSVKAETVEEGLMVVLVYCAEATDTLPTTYRTDEKCHTLLKEDAAASFVLDGLAFGFLSLFVFATAAPFDPLQTDYFQLTETKSVLVFAGTFAIYKEAEGVAEISATTDTPNTLAVEVSLASASEALFCLLRSVDGKIAARVFWSATSLLRLKNAVDPRTEVKTEFTSLSAGTHFLACATTHYPHEVANRPELSSSVVVRGPFTVRARGQGVRKLAVVRKGFDSLTVQIDLLAPAVDVAVVAVSESPLERFATGLTTFECVTAPCKLVGLEKDAAYFLLAFAVPLGVSTNQWELFKSSVYVYPHSVRVLISPKPFQQSPALVEVLATSADVAVVVADNNYVRCAASRLNEGFSGTPARFWSLEQEGYQLLGTLSPKNVASAQMSARVLQVPALQPNSQHFFFCASSGGSPAATAKNPLLSSLVVRTTPRSVQSLKQGSGVQNLAINPASVTDDGFVYTFTKMAKEEQVVCLAVDVEQAREKSLTTDLSSFWHAVTPFLRGEPPLLDSTKLFAIDVDKSALSLQTTTTVVGLDFRFVYTLLCASIYDAQDDAANNAALSSKVETAVPAKVRLLRPGVGFLHNSFSVAKVTASSITIAFEPKQNGFDQDLFRCVASATETERQLRKNSFFWSAEPEENDKGGGFVQAVTDSTASFDRHIDLTQLADSTSFALFCASSSGSAAETAHSSFLASEIIRHSVRVQTLGQNKALLGVRPNKVVRAVANTLVFTGSPVGDGALTKLALVRSKEQSLCAQSELVFYFNKDERTVSFVGTDTGVFRFCVTGDNGKTWYLQTEPGLSLEVVAADPTSVLSLGSSFQKTSGVENLLVRLAPKLEHELAELHALNQSLQPGSVRAFQTASALTRHKLAYGNPTCATPAGHSFFYTEQVGDANFQFVHVPFRALGSFPVCYSNDFGYNWTAQTTLGLRFQVYSTEKGPHEAALSAAIFPGAMLEPEFSESVFQYTLLVSAKKSGLEAAFHTKSVVATLHRNFLGRGWKPVPNEGSLVVFEGLDHVPISTEGLPRKIVPRVLVVRVTAEDGVTTTNYSFALTRYPEFSPDTVLSLSPKRFVSGEPTVFHLNLEPFEKTGLEIVGFVSANSENCAFPATSTVLSRDNKGSVILIGYEKDGSGSYKLCFSTNYGRTFHLVDHVTVAVVDDESVFWLTLLVLVTTLGCLLLLLYFARLARTETRAHPRRLAKYY